MLYLYAAVPLFVASIILLLISRGNFHKLSGIMSFWCLVVGGSFTVGFYTSPYPNVYRWVASAIACACMYFAILAMFNRRK